VVAWVGQDLGCSAEPLTSEKGSDLLVGAGLADIVTRTYDVDVRGELGGLVQRYGCGGMLAIYGRMLVLYARNPAYRQFLRDLRSQGISPDNVGAYLGYGLYVGRKV
jgi:hypothetical protein